jgi:hypothetical protein
VKATGLVHGGNAPITGSTIQLWAVGSSALQSGATALLTTTVTTSDGTSSTTDGNANAGNANNTLPAGSFTITGLYSCPVGDPYVYITASGGNPGLAAGTNNSAILLMTALTDCNTLLANAATTFITINEVTTIASVYALQEYSSKTAVIGAPSANTAGMESSFGFVKDLVNTATGAALTVDAAGNSVPQTTIDTMADILVPCVNSTGPTSTDCTTLFTTETCCGSVSNVFAVAYDMTIAPASKTSQLFALSSSNAPFQPTLTAPAVFELVLGGAANYTCGYGGAGAFSGGTVSYSGTKTGRIYLALLDSGCAGAGAQGTSIAAPGTYSIGGVPPGQPYLLSAFMDTLGTGVPNAADPSATLLVTGGTSNNITLEDPPTVALGSGPSYMSLSPFNSGILVIFSPIKVNGIEAATSYTLQWSTSSSFSSIAGSQAFNANGTDDDAWFVNGLTDGSVYYFRAYGTSAGTAIGPYSAVYGPVTIGAPSIGNAVSGSVTFSGSPTAPLYVGLYNPYTSVAYLQYIASPASPQTYTVTVPNSAAPIYQPVAFIDKNKDGVIDVPDYQNINSYGAIMAVAGPVTNVNQTFPSGNSVATVTTQHYYNAGSASNYGLTFSVDWVIKLPVAVQLLDSTNADGANVVGAPTSIALCGQYSSNCGQGFQFSVSLANAVPTVGDTYFFSVTYSDGTSGTISAAVTGVNSNFATDLVPNNNISTFTPAFSWADPVCSACGGYLYRFYLENINTGAGVWQVPGNGSGLSNATTSLAWGVDPTDSSNTPSVSTLSGVPYLWTITAQDPNGNQAIAGTSFTPP